MFRMPTPVAVSLAGLRGAALLALLTIGLGGADAAPVPPSPGHSQSAAGGIDHRRASDGP